MTETYFKLIRSVPTRAFQPLVLKSIQDRTALQGEIENPTRDENEEKKFADSVWSPTIGDKKTNKPRGQNIYPD